MSDADEYAKYAGLGHNHPKVEVPEVTELAKKQFALEVEIAAIEARLEEKKQQLKTLSEWTIPEVLDSLGISEYTTKEGLKVVVKEKVRASLLVENRPKGHEWLEDEGYSASIDREVLVHFGRGEDEAASKFVEEMTEKGRTSTYKKSVNVQRLDALLRRRMEAGEEVPLDIFSVSRQRVAEITKKEK